jgi:hypothetical protein
MGLMIIFERQLRFKPQKHAGRRAMRAESAKRCPNERNMAGINAI